MAVNLSFIGGAGWQFFDNNGVPLAGGKIYTYAAGTTVPLATYTSRTGLTANANPIILDAAGRTPEQIWSTEGLLYKYVVADANNVVLRTWDNIGGSVVASDLAQDLANTSDNAKGDALIGFKQSDSAGFLTGAVARTVNTKLQEIVSVKDFGAVGDGVANDTAAIQAAITSGKPIYFPAGVYICAAKITKGSGDLVLVGDGASVSEIRFTGSTSSTAGIYFTPQVSEDYTRIEGLTFSTTTGYTLNKNALHIDGTAQVAAGPPPITLNRSTRRIYINDIIVSGINDSASTGWSAGVKITSLGWFNITNYTYMGDFSQGNGTGNWKGQGIWIQGAGLPVEGRITNFSMYSAEFGVLMPDYFEGLYINTFDMVNVQYGVYARYSASWSTVLPAESGVLQPTISQGHINARRFAINAAKVNQASISGLNIYINPETGDSNYGGVLLDDGASNNISFNQIAKQNAATTTLSWGITLINIARSNITGNQIYFFDDAGVFLNGSSADSNYVVNNLFFDTTAGVVGNSGASGNSLILNEGLLLSGSLYSVDPENYIQKRQYATTFVATLTGGAASEVVTFTMPSGIFAAKPQAAFLTQTDVGASPNQLICYYNYTTSTNTFVQFTVVNNSGGNITSGLTRFVISIFE